MSDEKFKMTPSASACFKSHVIGSCGIGSLQGISTLGAEDLRSVRYGLHSHTRGYMPGFLLASTEVRRQHMVSAALREAADAGWFEMARFHNPIHPGNVVALWGMYLPGQRVEGDLQRVTDSVERIKLLHPPAA